MYTLENILNKYNGSDKREITDLITETLIPLQKEITNIRTPYFNGEIQRTAEYENADAMLHRHAIHMHEVAMEGNLTKTKTIMSGYVEYAKKFISGNFKQAQVKKIAAAVMGDSIDLVQLFGYSTGSQITKGLNSVKSDLVSYKPYSNLSKNVATKIVEAIKPVNKKANTITL